MKIWIALTIGLISIVALWPSHGRLLGWDEVDYVNAAKLGVKANMLEQTSLKPAAYLKMAQSKLANQVPLLPSDYNESQDTLLLRHYHPPLVAIMLALLPVTQNERLNRSVQLLGALLLSLAIFWGYSAFSPSPTWYGIIAISILTIWINVNLFVTLSFHGWMAIWITTCSTLFVNWLRDQSTHGVVLPFALALCALTLETGIIIILITLACIILKFSLYRIRRDRVIYWKQVIKMVIITTLVIVIFWPGVVLKASLVKIPALHWYRFVYMQSQEYASISARSDVLLLSLLPIFAAIMAIAWIYVKDRDLIKLLMPSVVLGGLYIIILARFALSPVYLLPGFAPLICVIGIAINRNRSKVLQLCAVMAILCLVIMTKTHLSIFSSDQLSRSDLNEVKKVILESKAYGEGAHVYQYYLGSKYQIKPLTITYDATTLMTREKGYYRTLTSDDISDAVLVIEKRPNRAISGEAAIMLHKCSKGDRNFITIWDCRSDRGE